jgi:hypothetical protein
MESDLNIVAGYDLWFFGQENGFLRWWWLGSRGEGSLFGSSSPSLLDNLFLQMVLTAFRQHQKSSLDAKAAVQKERDEKQRKLDEKRQKEKKEQEKVPSAKSDSHIQELTDEEADKLQKEIDAEKAGKLAQIPVKLEEKKVSEDEAKKVSQCFLD